MPDKRRLRSAIEAQIRHPQDSLAVVPFSACGTACARFPDLHEANASFVGDDENCYAFRKNIYFCLICITPMRNPAKPSCKPDTMHVTAKIKRRIASR